MKRSRSNLAGLSAIITIGTFKSLQRSNRELEHNIFTVEPNMISSAASLIYEATATCIVPGPSLCASILDRSKSNVAPTRDTRSRYCQTCCLPVNIWQYS